MRALCGIVILALSYVPTHAWSESRLYGGVVCHEREAASHLSERLLSVGASAAERSYHLLRSLNRNREPQSLASHLRPRPLHVCECMAVTPLGEPAVLIEGRESIGVVLRMEQALPHPLYREWAYIRVVFHVSGLHSICEPLTN